MHLVSGFIFSSNHIDHKALRGSLKGLHNYKKLLYLYSQRFHDLDLVQIRLFANNKYKHLRLYILHFPIRQPCRPH